MSRPGPLARQFINAFQGGFPVAPRPFRQVAVSLGIGEAALVLMVRNLVAAGWLSRFGPVFDAGRLGGAQTLAAMRVPEADFERVAGRVNAVAEVAHNYRREHPLNMWFVVSAESPQALAAALERVRGDTGLAVYDFPKRREFYLGLWLRLHADGRVDTVPAPAAGVCPGYRLDAVDRRIVRACQEGLPLTTRPYREVAGRAGCDEHEVLERLQRMLHHGAVRRIGAVPNHYRLGLVHNGMTVWDVADADIAEVGEGLAALSFVSHCYERPRHPGVWRYNLFAMVHADHAGGIDAKRAAIRELLGDRCRAGEVLLSSRILKKTGLRLAA
jgi:DNA-binding Lrp family transcriptional regulator